MTARKDDAPAADQAAITNVAALMPSSAGGGLIQTTEVGAFYWTAWAPEIVNCGREEQDSVSV